jgi:putative SOS response-associated peptidase YedK
MRVDLALIERYSGATTIFSAVGATVADFAPRCQSDPMCNRFRSKLGWVDWMEDFSQIKIPLRFPDPLPNLREELRPTNEVAIIRPMDPANPVDGMEGAVMRWDLIPSYWKQPIKAKTFLCTNARSETVATTSAFKGAFAKRRCLIPADAFFEQKVAERVRRMSPEALDSLLRDGEDENSN